MDLEKQNIEKKLSAEAAVKFAESGMTVGLGSGSTVFFAIKKLGELVRSGLNIRAVSTSTSTSALAQTEGINLISIDEAGEIDLTIDGADEVDKDLNGIKGGGGALLFEKIVALSSKKNIWIVDSYKVVEKLGKFPLPVEVIPVGYKRVFNKLHDMNLKPVIRMKGNDIYFTDSGNFIFDLHTGEIEDIQSINNEIKLLTGVLVTGLFINIADKVIVGMKDTTMEINK